MSYVKSVTFDCRDALVVARFWAGALGGELDEDSTSDKAHVEAPGWAGPVCGSSGCLRRRPPS